MAENHFGFDRSGNKSAGYRLGKLLDDGESFLNRLIAERGTMLAMRDGDGSQDIHYAQNTTNYGFANDAEAKKAFLELDSVHAKVNTDGAVSGVVSALRQLFDRLRS